MHTTMKISKHQATLKIVLATYRLPINWMMHIVNSLSKLKE